MHACGLRATLPLSVHVRACTRALSRAAFDCSELELVERLPRIFARKLRDENPSVRRGAALALGALPKQLLLAAPLADIVTVLVTATQIERVVSRRDAETRRNAVEGLVDVVRTVGLAVYGASGVSLEQTREVFAALIKATEDYSTDSRGDVGSWVRRAAVDGLLRFVSLVLLFPGQQLVATYPGFPEGGVPPPAQGRARLSHHMFGRGSPPTAVSFGAVTHVLTRFMQRFS